MFPRSNSEPQLLRHARKENKGSPTAAEVALPPYHDRQTSNDLRMIEDTSLRSRKFQPENLNKARWK